jgi:predicted dehydrogenase
MAHRALIVGAGSMGRAWARTVLASDRATMCGWVDIDLSVAQSSSAELQLDTYLDSALERAIARTSPDFVVDVSTPESHRDVTLSALRSGIPVLGEKPMAASMDEAREMVRASEAAGKLYMVSQNRRYNQRIRTYGAMLQRLGDLGILSADFYLAPRFGGFRDQMESPLVLDMAIHTLDAARFLTGRDAVSVYCEEFNPSWSWYEGNACATAVFEMEGGLRFTYRGSWCAEGLPTSWDSDWRAVGSHGTALWHGDEMPISSVEGEVQVEEQPEGIDGSLAEFLDALEIGRTPMCECHDNIKSLIMVHAAIESARTGKRVLIN